MSGRWVVSLRPNSEPGVQQVHDGVGCPRLEKNGSSRCSQSLEIRCAVRVQLAINGVCVCVCVCVKFMGCARMVLKAIRKERREL